jgi:hypothetical protein
MRIRGGGKEDIQIMARYQQPSLRSRVELFIFAMVIPRSTRSGRWGHIRDWGELVARANLAELTAGSP